MARLGMISQLCLVVEVVVVVVVVYSLNLKHGDFYNDMSIECNALFI